ncbi:MAG TPA: DUF3791 domain-containing protein [Clostridiales bacterium]|nr:DUF3791 domain-containing protein [Clostridiales bacterium]
MNANKTLLQRKYARVIAAFARRKGISLREAMDFFYQSFVYTEMSEGISDMHCRSDEYLAEELTIEYAEKIKDIVAETRADCSARHKT